MESIRVPKIGAEWEEGSPLLAVCITQRNNDVQLTVKAAHAIADGRAVEGIYRIVANVLDESVPCLVTHHYLSLGNADSSQ